jgi:hypothetical protein
MSLSAYSVEELRLIAFLIAIEKKSGNVGTIVSCWINHQFQTES